ncbi:hypothetical protein ACFW1J_01500 [Priestia aryabhattai]
MPKQRKSIIKTMVTISAIASVTKNVTNLTTEKQHHYSIDD